MNSLIDLLDLALQANLSKRQWAAFAAVLRQTMGYRKSEDDLSPRRMEQLTGIRRNHIWQAKKELEALGLLQSRPGHYGEILSFSPPTPPPFRPETVQSAPETGQPDARIGPETVPKQDTTLSNLTQNNHDSTVGGEVASVMSARSVEVVDGAEKLPELPDSGLSYPPDLSPFEREKAPRHLDGLTPAAAQQVLDIWALKISRGEVRKSRLGLLAALAKAQRSGQLHTDALLTSHPSHLTDPQQQQRLQEREQWLEQQAQQGWLRDMASLSGLPPDQFQAAGFTVPGGAT